MNEVLGHHDGESQVAEACECFGQAFVVSGQATETSHPTETPFDDPAPRQEHEAFLGFWQLDHEQLQALIFSGLGRLIAGITLIDRGDLDRISSDFLHRSAPILPPALGPARWPG